MSDKVMQIEIKEKGTRAFYKEVVCAIVQYPGLIRKPESRLKDSFRVLKVYMAVGVVFFALCAGMGIAWGVDALTVAACVIMLAVIVISGMQLYRLNNMVRSYMEDPRPSVLTLDEEGVELSKEGAERVKIAWDNVAFVRVFSESVCFFSGGIRGLVMSVNKSHEQQILEYLKDNQVNVRIIG